MNFDFFKTEYLFFKINGKVLLSGRSVSSSVIELFARSDRVESGEREGFCLNGGVFISRSLEFI